MNAELIIAVLSLLGDLPAHPHASATIPPPVYATWTTPITIEYACPDPTSGLNPMGTPAVVSRTESKCGADGCVSATIAAAVTLYPDNKICRVDAKENHRRMFPSMLEAGLFRVDCGDGKCQDWTARDATEDETRDYVLERKGWKMDRIPAGDAVSYPQGVWQVWPKDETRFDAPIGSGSTALGALADALKGDRP